MKSNKIKIMIIAVLATIIAGGAILNSCKKDNELLTNDTKAKVTKNGALENPFFV